MTILERALKRCGKVWEKIPVHDLVYEDSWWIPVLLSASQREVR
jgi:hypothetical protein